MLEVSGRVVSATVQIVNGYLAFRVGLAHNMAHVHQLQIDPWNDEKEEQASDEDEGSLYELYRFHLCHHELTRYPQHYHMKVQSVGETLLPRRDL